ncbi:MAG: indolepyruvate ferredoxin oxidoreductase subunit alpha [Candidatus Bathyarchaeota archaeon]|nr:indolepyruvate ferredoxin oxidoreductase subunit alpha [Candidatus Bathyarchaeota archaeon]
MLRDLAKGLPGERVFLLGNEAIARGAMEGGVQIAAAYPGTPSTEILETLAQASKHLGLYVEWSTNEKVALEVALGASICGLRAMASMKHVGVNVAHDSLMTAGYMGVKGGLVVVSADDVRAWSSQNEQDNRFTAKQAYLPVLEPSNVQEAKDWTADAFELSEKFNQVFMLRTVTRINHARGDVTLGKLPKKHRKGVFRKDPSWLTHVPTTARKNRPLMIQRFKKISQAVNRLPYNSLELVDEAKLGVIACGLSYAYTLEATKWLGLDGKVSLLKVGTTHPIPEDLVKRLLSSVEEVLVVEELEPFVELHVKAIAGEENIKIKVHGKDLIPLIGELSTRKVTEALAELTKAKLPIDFSRLDQLRKETAPLIPSRPPALCPGCPHRASFYAIKTAAKSVAKNYGVEPIYPGDIGCYSLAVAPPLETVDTLISMGASIGVANGLAHVVRAPILACIGDSTFFHAGIPPLINAVYNHAKITVIVLDNLTTAMTGFQPHPGSGFTATGVKTTQLKAENVAKGCGVRFVEVADPFDSRGAIDVVQRALMFEGPSLVVFRRKCTLMELQEKRKRGEKVVPYIVDAEKCKQCGVCIKTFACPAIIKKDKNYAIDDLLCTGCGFCAEICPYEAIHLRGKEHGERI